MTNWRYEIKHGPDGEANYAWIYKGDLFVATMRTHHAVEIVKALSASPAGVVKPTPLSDKLRYEADGMFAAIQGEDYGDTLHLHNWHDKPHRVVYDAVDLLRQAADEIDNLAARIMSAIEPAGVGVETAPPQKHVAPLTPLETELLTALKRFRDTIIGEVHDKWDEGMRAGKLIVALANPTLPYRRDVTEIHEAIAKAEARAALATTEGSEG